MIYSIFIFGLVVLAAELALAYRNKILNRRQTRKVRCEVKVTPRKIRRD